MLERQLQERIMRGDHKPEIRRISQGNTLVEQESATDELFLLLNGVLVVEVDGQKLAERSDRVRCSVSGRCSKERPARRRYGQ